MKKFIFSIFVAMIFSTFSSNGQGNCLYFDGTDDYISVANHSSLNFGTGSFTIEFWIKTNNSSSTALGLINKKANSTSSGWVLFFKNGQIGTKVNSNSTQWWGVAGNLNDNVWHHVAIVFYAYSDDIDGDLWQGTAYFDGQNSGSIIFTRTTVTNSESLLISKHYSGGYFSGYLEEIRIWNTARTETQIQSNMHSQISGSASGLVAYWRFNESSGSSANDETSNNNDGTLNNMSNSNWVTSTVPMPFRTSGSGNWSSTNTWLSSTIPNSQYTVVEIDHNITVDDDYTVGKLTNNATITINPTASLVLKDQLVNSSGTIKVTSNSAGSIGSFKDAGTGSFGTNVLERYFTDNKWHYFSSPISTLSSNAFSGGAIWKYDETTPGWSRVPLNTNLEIARGYDVYFANTGAKQLTFTGTFNTGEKSCSLTYSSSAGQGYNLVGNPYPSTIDWDASSGWSRTNVNSSIYVWNPNTSSVETYVLNGGQGTNGGSRYIPATQGFFVVCTQNTTLTMNNNVRVTNDDRTLRENFNSNELRIKISGFGYSDETLIRFNPEASNRYDGLYDASKFYSYNREIAQIYTLDKQNIEYAIQSIPNITDNEVVPLNLYIGTEGFYELTFDKSHLSENCNIILEDKLTHQFIDLNSQDKYSFFATYTDQVDRFLLHFYQNQQVFNLSTNEKTAQNLEVYTIGKTIYVYNPSEKPENTIIKIYCLSGECLYEKELNFNGLISFEPDLIDGVFILTMQSGNKLFNKKIPVIR